jgi:hypothetical protein
VPAPALARDTGRCAGAGAALPRPASADRAASLSAVFDPCHTGLCASDIPPLIGSVLTGTGLTLAQAAAALERGDVPPLTPVQRRIVEEFAAAGRSAR